MLLKTTNTNTNGIPKTEKKETTPFGNLTLLSLVLFMAFQVVLEETC